MKIEVEYTPFIQAGERKLPSSVTKYAVIDINPKDIRNDKKVQEKLEHHLGRNDFKMGIIRTID